MRMMAGPELESEFAKVAATKEPVFGGVSGAGSFNCL